MNLTILVLVALLISIPLSIPSVIIYFIFRKNKSFGYGMYLSIGVNLLYLILFAVFGIINGFKELDIIFAGVGFVVLLMLSLYNFIFYKKADRYQKRYLKLHPLIILFFIILVLTYINMWIE